MREVSASKQPWVGAGPPRPVVRAIQWRNRQVPKSAGTAGTRGAARFEAIRVHCNCMVPAKADGRGSSRAAEYGTAAPCRPTAASASKSWRLSFPARSALLVMCRPNSWQALLRRVCLPRWLGRALLRGFDRCHVQLLRTVYHLQPVTLYES